jgi:hypothetical protein
MANFPVPHLKLRGIHSLPPIQPQQGIRFSDLSFSEPSPFAIAQTPNYGGLYAVMAFDTNWGPQPYRPIYAGQAGNLAEKDWPGPRKVPIMETGFSRRTALSRVPQN